jgi:hypothetical protein
MTTPNELTVPNTTDARVWARDWLRTIAEHPDIPTDEGTMIGWFANAIMAGHDDATRKLSALASPAWTIRGLVWEEDREGHWSAATVFGPVDVSVLSDGSVSIAAREGPTARCDLETAKADIQAHHKKIITPFLEPARLAPCLAPVGEDFLTAVCSLLRLARVRSDQGLREFADAINVKASELCDMEHGRKMLPAESLGKAVSVLDRLWDEARAAPSPSPAGGGEHGPTMLNGKAELQWLREMAAAEDKFGSVSVGGLAVEVGLPIASPPPAPAETQDDSTKGQNQ